MYIKPNVSKGTASNYDVPTSGDASTTQVVKGDDTRLTDSRNAADVSAWAKASTKPTYTASEVGAVAVDAGFAHTDNITYNPDTKTVTCLKSGASNWDSSIYSRSGYFDNVFVTFKPVDKNMYFMMGLNDNPSESVAFTDIDYCWFCQGGGSLYIFESGTQITPPAGHTTYSGGDELRIEYSGGYVKYYHNGELVRSVERAIGNPLYLDSSFYNSGSVYDVEFGTSIGQSVNKGDWTVLVNTSTCVIAYKIDDYNVNLYLDYKAVAADWVQVATLPEAARPFYTHYKTAYVDLALSAYKVYHIDKNTGAISVKGNAGTIPIYHSYPIV